MPDSSAVPLAVLVKWGCRRVGAVEENHARVRVSLLLRLMGALLRAHASLRLRTPRAVVECLLRGANNKAVASAATAPDEEVCRPRLSQLPRECQAIWR